MKPKKKPARNKHKLATSAKAGLAPGTLVHVGEIRTPVPAMQLTSFDADHLHEDVPADAAALRHWEPPCRPLWLNVHGLQDAALMKAVGQRFALHPLVMEDILNTQQRPKVEDWGDYVYCVIRMFAWRENPRALESDQISIIVGRDFVLSFQERSTGVFDAVRQRLRVAGSSLRSGGPDLLAHALIDTLVDGYFGVLERLGGSAEDLEDEAAGAPRPELQQRINALKHELRAVRRALWPLRDMLGSLVRSDSQIFHPATRPYLRDVLDHSVLLAELLEEVRELLGDALNLYLSSMSNRLNREVRVLTVLTMLFVPAALIAGIFGMNFDRLPWMHEHDGFWFAIALMAATAALLASFFWRRAWLRSD